MPEFLTDDWLEALGEAASQAVVSPELHLVVEQVITDGAGADRSFTVRIGDGRVTVQPGRDANAEVSFVQDRATAAAIAAGELSAQAAFMAGRLRVEGDLRAVLDRAREVAALDDVFARVRDDTSW